MPLNASLFYVYFGIFWYSSGILSNLFARLGNQIGHSGDINKYPEPLPVRFYLLLCCQCLISLLKELRLKRVGA